MKKLSVALVTMVVLGCTHTALAQQSPATLKSQAMEATQKLAARISLDDARTMQVRRLTLERLTQESDLQQLYANDPSMLQNKARVLEQEYSEKLKSVLTDSQYQRYLAQLAVAPENQALVSGNTRP
ncbi:hypothetical protein SAMN06265337_2806 [Hymenobacter gelipurpurascens]|uniref:LTXXQ motif family protein n=1 Tax=Hymenobacter gelipurpurascens TaxID=89968 RepID=A0A212UAI0_9BACT|nr:hypothetical protein [Hymenobacter gelipurpurascens]SNC75302.1 hypothetical protein SAMN06265337_2806 [Hymenobacter gelipurpurascens]